MTTPDIPANFRKDDLNSDSSQITIIWEAGPTFYGAAIIDYKIYYDEANGDGVFVVLDDAVLGTSLTLTPVVTGLTY